jgi:multimeric flavodoxin WrbA
MSRKRLLIVGHVPSPNTQRLRNAVEEGARHRDIDGVDVVALSPFDTGPEDVIAADAFILGTTENLGYMSGALKDFFDRCYYPVIEQTEARPFTYYIRAGLDGTGTRRAIDSITGGLRWKCVQEPHLYHGEWRDTFVDQARELGMAMAAGLDAGVF